MAVLYRKYRPQQFADVVGQEHITRTIVAAIATDRIAHAYLFSGPRGVGKTTTARLLAKALNCEHDRRRTGESKNKKSAVPCATCTRCREIAEGHCVDVIEIDAASHTQVDKVREHIIEAVRVVPALARRKVYIIDEVHMLSTSSFNALLKTIEEPPDHAFFILATTELHKVPETIRSRCQHFAFRRVGVDALVARLAQLASAEGIQVHTDVLNVVARMSDGSVRDAESLLGQLFALGEKVITVDDAALVLPRSSTERVRALLDAIARGDARVVVEEIQRAEDEGFDADAYIREALTLLREDVHVGISTSDGAQDTIVTLRVFTQLIDQLGRSDRPFLALEVVALERCLRMRPVKESDDEDPPMGGAVSEESPPPKRAAQTQRVRANATTSTVASHVSHDALLAKVRSGWTSFVVKIGQAHHSLPYLLEGGRPQRVEDGTLTIGFRYQLHAEKVRHPKMLDIVTRAIGEFVGASLRIAPVVVSAEEFAALDAAARPRTGDQVIDAALEVFGGRVID